MTAWKELDTEIYETCGRLILNWWHIDQAWNVFLLALRHHNKHPLRPDQQAYSDFPVSMKKKIAEIRAYMKATPACAAIHDRMHSLSVESMNVHAIRSTIAHAFCQPNGPHLGDKYEFGVCDQKRGYIYAKRYFSMAELESAAERMLAIGSAVTALSDQVRPALSKIA